MSKSALQEALKYHQAGDVARAEQLYLAMLAENPKQAEVLHLLGILHAQQQNYSQALTFIQQAITYDAEEPTFYNSLGNTYKNLGQLAEAITAYQQALQINPNYAVAHNNLGNIYHQKNDFTAAEEHYQKAIQLKPDYLDAYFNLATILTKTQRYPEAIKNFEKTLSIEPNHAAAHGQLAQLLQQQGQLDSAIQHYEQSLAIEPKQADIHQQLATALIKQGKLVEAEQHLLKTLESDSKHREALYNLGTVYLILGKANEALRYFLRLLSLQPEPEIYYNIGVIYMHQDRLQDAIEYFTEATRRKPDYLDAYLNLGATNLKKGDYANAIKNYQIALKFKPNDPEISYLLSALTQKDMPATAPNEYLRNLFDEYAPYFDAHLQQQLAYQVPNLIAQTLTEETKPNNADWQILDLGCGTGLAGELIRKCAKRLIGIDIAPRMIEQAEQKKIYDELAVMDIQTALSQYRQLDVIVAADVFTYIGDLGSIFNLAYQALNPGGWFIFTVEKTHQYPFHLQTSARYSHNKQYITELTKQTGFQPKVMKLATLRTQQGQPVTGFVVLLRK